MQTEKKTKKISVAVVIPAFKVSSKIVSVIKEIDKSVSNIFVIDDKCPEQSGTKVRSTFKDKRIQVLFNESNLGVGGSTMRGYVEAMKTTVTYVVKLDGDGQMDPKLISKFVNALELTGADYAKGNRFANPEDIGKMPKVRILGNVLLSFLAKFSTGYWHIFDPNNGFTVIRSNVLRQLPLQKISKRYFFESDMLFRLNLLHAFVLDIPMSAIYGSEKSNLKISKTLIEFPYKHLRNFLKRIAYNYFMRDFNLASLQLILSSFFLFFGITIGGINLFQAISTETSMSVGVLVLVSILTISGLQLLLSFFTFDMNVSRQRKFW